MEETEEEESDSDDDAENKTINNNDNHVHGEMGKGVLNHPLAAEIIGGNGPLGTWVYISKLILGNHKGKWQEPIVAECPTE